MAHHQLHGARAPSASPPLKDEAPTVRRAGLRGNQESSGSTRILAQAEAVDKDFDMLRERAVLAGQTLERVDARDGDPAFYRVSRWGLSRSLPDLQSVSTFIDRVGGDHERASKQ